LFADLQLATESLGWHWLQRKWEGHPTIVRTGRRHRERVSAAREWWTYLDVRSLWRLTLVGEAHVSAKPEGVGLVVYTHLRGRGRESQGHGMRERGGRERERN